MQTLIYKRTIANYSVYYYTMRCFFVIFIVVIISHIKGIFMKTINAWLMPVCRLLTHPMVLMAVVVIQTYITVPPGK